MRFGDIDLACELDVQPGPGHDVTLADPARGCRRAQHRGHHRPTPYAARVADVEFLGSFCRAELALDGGERRLVADFSINVMRDLAIDDGKDMLIALPSERLRVFPRAAPTAVTMAATPAAARRGGFPGGRAAGSTATTS